MMEDFEPKWEYQDRELGKGGQAHTYLVRERAEPHRFGAAKRLSDKSREDRFRQELRACASIDHPNVLSVLDEGMGSKGRPYFVAEYCEKGELTIAHLAGKTMIDIVRLFREICSGVAEAHRKKIVHRDIKPANILIRNSGVPVVADFGICFLIDRDLRDPRLTETQQVVASRWFGAPEARDGRVEDVSAAADVYSLGKLLYWMLSGGRIFDREDHRNPKFALNEHESLDPHMN